MRTLYSIEMQVSDISEARGFRTLIVSQATDIFLDELVTKRNPFTFFLESQLLHPSLYILILQFHIVFFEEIFLEMHLKVEKIFAFLKFCIQFWVFS